MAILKRFALLTDLFICLRFAFWPTFWCVWASPSLLFRPRALSRIFMSHVWTAFGSGVDEHKSQIKTSLITQNAYGVVLDIGAGIVVPLALLVFLWVHLAQGHGHTAKYLDRSRVTKYVALEPNVLMHNEIRASASAAGFSEADGTFALLVCGAEDTTTILTCLGGYQPVDTLVSVLTLCSVPDPRETITALTKEVLKPGGQMLYIEHVQSPLSHIAWWQTFWTPLWALAFDGCRLDRPTHVWIQQVGGWASQEVSGADDEDEEHLFWHRVGKLVKAT